MYVQAKVALELFNPLQLHFKELRHKEEVGEPDTLLHHFLTLLCLLVIASFSSC